MPDKEHQLIKGIGRGPVITDSTNLFNENNTISLIAVVEPFFPEKAERGAYIHYEIDERETITIPIDHEPSGLLETDRCYNCDIVGKCFQIAVVTDYVVEAESEDQPICKDCYHSIKKWAETELDRTTISDFVAGII